MPRVAIRLARNELRRVRRGLAALLRLRPVQQDGPSEDRPALVTALRDLPLRYRQVRWCCTTWPTCRSSRSPLSWTCRRGTVITQLARGRLALAQRLGTANNLQRRRMFDEQLRRWFAQFQDGPAGPTRISAAHEIRRRARSGGRPGWVEALAVVAVVVWAGTLVAGQVGAGPPPNGVAGPPPPTDVSVPVPTGPPSTASRPPTMPTLPHPRR